MRTASLATLLASTPAFAETPFEESTSLSYAGGCVALVDSIERPYPTLGMDFDVQYKPFKDTIPVTDPLEKDIRETVIILRKLALYTV